MTFFEILNTVIILPLKYFFEFIFMTAYEVTENPGLSIIVLSLIMNVLLLPLYNRADAMQEEEREAEKKLSRGVSHIKKTFKGDEKMMILQTYYRQNHYSPLNVFKGAASLMLEIPFFIAAYQFLSNLDILRGVSFGPISNLGTADALLQIGSVSINILPIIMTAVNLISCLIFTKDYPRKTKIQLYSMAIFFLFFLYDSPAGLVFYWTLNNVFSLGKTIFYKLKHPKKVLRFLTLIVSVIIFAYGCTISYENYPALKLKVYILSILVVSPTLQHFFNSRHKVKSRTHITFSTNKRSFYLGAAFLTILTGILIPSSVISSSPQEFFSVYAFIHPLRYLLSTGLLAAGTFIGWVGVFYSLSTERTKKYFEAGIWIFCGIALMNYMFFNINSNTLSNTLVYTTTPTFSLAEIATNSLATIGITIIFLVIYTYKPKLTSQILSICLFALVGMSVYNINSINSSVSSITLTNETNENEPVYTLSKNGKNVIVLMLDRSLNELFPYLIEEKPELKEQFAGFTYYKNTISFGAYTNFATPSLFGGYEYTPYEINKRSDELLVDKQNEALKVMPVLFDQNGFDVTVFQPTYANYQWIPDLSIYDEYPNINAFNTDGRFTSTNLVEATFETNERNFYFYSLMNVSPLFARSAIYDRGNYKNSYNRFTQTIKSPTESKGENKSFLDSYSVLQMLPNLANIENSTSNTFLMMTNDTTHEPTLLQEPNYTPAEYVNNAEFENADMIRKDADGNKIQLDSEKKAIHYHANMAAMLEIGQWLDYLRTNDVYDNSRIIIVGDHGRSVDYEQMYVDNNTSDSLFNTEYYYPLLLVKDFGETELVFSNEFMTNADVPTIATSNLIENPTNPTTGKPINNNAKYSQTQYIFGSTIHSPMYNNGTQFLPGVWFSVHDDRNDMNNWTVLQEDAVFPLSEDSN